MKTFKWTLALGIVLTSCGGQEPQLKDSSFETMIPSFWALLYRMMIMLRHQARMPT
jgi:hypothetical protein